MSTTIDDVGLDFTTAKIALVCDVLLFAFHLLVPPFFFLRRNIFPIQGREWFLILAFQFFSFTNVVSMLIYLSDLNRPCFMRGWIAIFSVHGVCLTYVLRAWGLLCKCEITANLARIKAKTDKGEIVRPEDEGWFLRNRGYAKREFFIKCLGIYVIIAFCINGLFHAIDPKYNSMKSCNASIVDVVNSGGAVLWISVIGWLAYKLRPQSNDGFDIKRELSSTCKWSIAMVIPFVVLINGWPKFAIKYCAPEWVTITIFGGDSLMCVGWPLFRTYWNQYTDLETEEDVATRFKELDKVLLDLEAFEAFYHFLETEFATENAVFWRRVNEFKQLVTDEEVVKQAEEIYRDHVSLAARMEVNIPSHMRSEIEARMQRKDISLDLFNQAQEEIYQLMKTDSFQRFRKKVEAREIRLPSRKPGSPQQSKTNRSYESRDSSRDDNASAQASVTEMIDPRPSQLIELYTFSRDVKTNWRDNPRRSAVDSKSEPQGKYSPRKLSLPSTAIPLNSSESIQQPPLLSDDDPVSPKEVPTPPPPAAVHINVLAPIQEGLTPNEQDNAYAV